MKSTQRKYAEKKIMPDADSTAVNLTDNADRYASTPGFITEYLRASELMSTSAAEQTGSTTADSSITDAPLTDTSPDSGITDALLTDISPDDGTFSDTHATDVPLNPFPDLSVPIYLTRVDDTYYLTEHRLPGHSVWRFQVEDNEIVHVETVY